jgi:hypothetical protein
MENNQLLFGVYAEFRWKMEGNSFFMNIQGQGKKNSQLFYFFKFNYFETD